jgi:hypothetical protein
MYSTTEILTAATGLVGWSSSTDAIYDSISSALKASSSGYYVNELPGVTVALLNYVPVDKSVCDYLPAIHNSETLKVIDAFLAKQKKDLATKELLSNVTLLQGYDDLDKKISQSGRFIGYAITPRESKSIVSKIQQVGFISDAAQSFTLYLYCTNTKSAIQSKTITISTPDTLEWTTLNWDIYFDSSTYGAGQRYLIGYFESDLTANLYESVWTGSQGHIAQRIFGHYMGISPMRFNSGTLNSTYIPDVKYLKSALNCHTPGFNLRFNVKCDITNVLVDHIGMFAQAVQYQVAIRILNDALSNIELNNVTSALQHRERRKELVTEYTGKLHGGLMENVGYIPGIIDRLSLDFSMLDSVCLQGKSNEIHGVRW